MERVFSIEEISERFWSPPPEKHESWKMNRSASEWALELFLRGENAVSDNCSSSSSSSPGGGKSSEVVETKGQRCSVGDREKNSFRDVPPPVDSEEHRALLKSKLNLACAAVASSQASFLKPHDSPAGADSGSQASSPWRLESHAPSKGVPVKPATSESSREQSEDDENEGETEVTENMVPADARRARRMLSNRESARRSRRRKQTHLTELETQVSQLSVENSSLLKRLTDASHKYNEAAVDNRVLKADVETLRAKVKMAEETVKRVTGLYSMFDAMPQVSSLSIPSLDWSSLSETSMDAAAHIQDDPKHHFYQSPKNGLADESPVRKMQPNA